MSFFIYAKKKENFFISHKITKLANNNKMGDFEGTNYKSFDFGDILTARLQDVSSYISQVAGYLLASGLDPSQEAKMDVAVIEALSQAIGKSLAVWLRKSKTETTRAGFDAAKCELSKLLSAVISSWAQAYGLSYGKKSMYKCFAQSIVTNLFASMSDELYTEWMKESPAAASNTSDGGG